MKKKDFIKIINEEISNFDFLGNQAQVKQEENYDLLKNEDFQKQFICDSLINKKNIKQKVTDARVGGDWDKGDDASKLTIEYFVDIEYTYDPNKEPAKFTVDFDSNGITIGIDTTSDPGTREIPPSGEASYNYIQWSDINVTLFTPDGDEIQFTALNKAPQKIQDLFRREYTEDFIASETADTNYLRKDSIRSIPYC